VQKIPHTGIRSPDSLARSELTYWLSITYLRKKATGLSTQGPGWTPKLVVKRKILPLLWI